MSLTNGKQRLMIVTVDFCHPTYHRIHSFLPSLSERFDIILIDIKKEYLTKDEINLYTFLYSFIQLSTIFAKVFFTKIRSIDNIYTVEMPGVKGGLLLSFMVVPLLVRKLIREYNVCLVWGVGPVAGYCVMLSRISVPFVYDDTDRHHLFYDNLIMRRVMQRIEKACILGADVVTSAGLSLYNSSKKIRGSKDEVVFLPNAVDLKETFKEISSPKLYDLIYVGIVDEWCGLDYVLEAMGRIVSYMPSLNIVVVGPIDGGYYRRLQRIIISQGLCRNVRFTGRLDHAQVMQYLNQSKIGAAMYPKTDLMKSAFTIKLLEYMATGLAIIASDVGDTAELVRKANCGIVVDPDPRSAAEAILRLIRDSDLQHQFGYCGRKYVSQNYDIEMVSMKLIQTFKFLVDSRVSS